MKQVLIDILPFEFKKTSLNESLKDGKLYVTGVLQRADAKNQNGRSSALARHFNFEFEFVNAALI